MLQSYPFVPVVGSIRIVVAIFSYDGGLYFGVTGDYDGAPDIDVLTGGIERGMEDLLALAGAERAARASRASRTSSAPLAGDQANERQRQRDKRADAKRDSANGRRRRAASTRPSRSRPAKAATPARRARPSQEVGSETVRRADFDAEDAVARAVVGRVAT